MTLRKYCLVITVLLTCGAAHTQDLYKYRGADGEWIYSDRAPADGNAAEVRKLSLGIEAPEVRVSQTRVDGHLRVVAVNEFHAPVEIVLALDEIPNLVAPPAAKSLRDVLAPQSETELLWLATTGDDPNGSEAPLRFLWLLGDPDSVHTPPRAYRVPFAVARTFPISQAFPDAMTHLEPESRYAVDLAMPVGTGIYAARGGTVVEVASTNYRGGTDESQDTAAANIVRVLHDDGTFAIYAHLNWNSIRVRPGDVVQRGQYIADSGNTGFSSGPHLHFVVIRNRGLRMLSVPVEFEGANANPVMPETGQELTAY